MKLQQKILVSITGIALAIDFLYVIAQRALTDNGGMQGDVFHTLLLVAAYLAFTLFALRKRDVADIAPMRIVGRIIIAATSLLLFLGLLQLSSLTEFKQIDGVIFPQSISTLVTSVILSATAGIAMIFVFLAITELIFVKRRKNTRRDYITLVVLLSLYMLTKFLSSPNGLQISSMSVPGTILFWLTVLAMIVNSFRFSWILSLNKREKLFNLLLLLFGFTFFSILAARIADEGLLHNALNFYHPVIYAFVHAVCVFGAIYTGIGFASTLLHLPTAKDFDRKRVEISSLQNMSRLITQVFDYDELVATTTYLALEVSEGEAAWLEVFDTGNKRRILPNSIRRITTAEIEKLRLEDGSSLQSVALQTGKPVVIQDFNGDRRVKGLSRQLKHIGSLSMIPLISHGNVIGLLCLTKKTSYGFDADALNVLNAFADLVAVALENSRLIQESIIKERLQQELLVAQQMQQSLLPRGLPESPQFEIAARSVPASEVGGDYYDVQDLGDGKLGLVVGDVSGKGVSAALYMAQVKGIFQSLSSDSSSTRDILVRMNIPLCNTTEKKSFISLLYAVLDTSNGQLTFSRAGHCPLLHISNGSARYLQPSGMALGLDTTERFTSSLQEETLQLRDGDIIVMYTDGVTEATNESGDEFQYKRLAETVELSSGAPAEKILGNILDAVDRHSLNEEVKDDITLLVLRWKNARA